MLELDSPGSVSTLMVISDPAGVRASLVQFTCKCDAKSET